MSAGKSRDPAKRSWPREDESEEGEMSEERYDSKKSGPTCLACVIARGPHDADCSEPDPEDIEFAERSVDVFGESDGVWGVSLNESVDTFHVVHRGKSESEAQMIRESIVGVLAQILRNHRRPPI